MKSIRHITTQMRSVAITAMLLLAGCAQEHLVTTPSVPSKEVLFHINIPNKSAPSARALGDIDENEVKTIEMLLFDPVSKEVVYNPVFANDVTSDPDGDGGFRKKSFSVRLPQGTFDVMVFANARAAFGRIGIAPGDPQEAILADLRASMPANGWASDPAMSPQGYLIPMWGMKEKVSVGEGGAITGIYLHRMLSRIDINVMGSAGETGDFKIKEIKLYNVQKEGRIAPAMANWNQGGQINGSVAAGLAIMPSTVPGCGVHASISYTSKIALDQKSCVGEIYLFEAHKASTHADQNAPFLTIKGAFNGVDGWYRIDLADYAGMNYLPVLRNHLYKIGIHKVSGTGFPHEEDAKKNRGDNIVVDISLWNEYNLGGTVFDGQYFLSVNPQDICYSQDKHVGQTLTIRTDNESAMTPANIQVSGSATDPHASVDWINNVSLSDRRVEHDKSVYTLTYDVAMNYGEARIGYVFVTLGRLTNVVRIEQEKCRAVITIPDEIWLSPSAGNSIKTVQCDSNHDWALSGAQPTNATVSPTGGVAGTSAVTITRSDINYGLSTFSLKSVITGETVTVAVDNYHIEQAALTISNAGTTGNTGVYDIVVHGGSKAFTIVDYSDWFTSATVLPNGKLALVADQSPNGEERTGFVTLAHANDPAYQVTFSVEQSLNVLDPFDFLVFTFTWNKDDADVAVRFFGNGASFDGKAVGYSLSNPVNFNGKELLRWGGDASGGQGETVFVNPQVINDVATLPRYLTIQVFATWYTMNRAPDAVTLTITTYEGGSMVQSGTNFNNVGGKLLMSEGFPCWVTTTRGKDSYGNGGYQHLCDVIYDRIKHTAKIVWYSAL